MAPFSLFDGDWVHRAFDAIGFRSRRARDLAGRSAVVMVLTWGVLASLAVATGLYSRLVDGNPSRQLVGGPVFVQSGQRILGVIQRGARPPMTRRFVMPTVFAAAILALVPVAARAQQKPTPSQNLKVTPLDVKLGLWNVTSTSDRAGELPMDMSKLTPDQRARIEQAMKNQPTSDTKTQKACITPETLRSLASELMERDGEANCTTSDFTSTSTVQQVTLTCQGERPSTSHLRFEATDHEHMNGGGTIVMSDPSGQHSMNIKFTVKATWQSASCGDVK
ncbi:MAG: DUF3617 family protein [Vicinamibacterales bacterium]